MDNNRRVSEEEAKRLVQEKEQQTPQANANVGKSDQSPDQSPTSLGKSEEWKMMHGGQDGGAGTGDLSGGDMYWKPFPVDTLPSGGMFYPHGTTIDIRAADVGEIRHFSTIDENDPLDVDDKLNVIIDKCTKIKFPGRTATWKDLKEEDRFCLIFAIREITFIDGENKLFVNVRCGTTCGGDGSYNERVEMRKENFQYYKIDPKLMRKYSEEQRCFVISNSKYGNDIKLYIPSLGVTNIIKNIMRDRVRKGEFYDRTFLKIAPFYFSDWRTLNENVYKKAEQDSFGWGNKRLSAILKLVDLIKFGVKPEITKVCNKCGAEVAAPLSFQGGIKSLFLYADDIDEILG